MVGTQRTKLSIVGAGSVGASIAFAALVRGSADDIVLTDIDAARAEAEVLDLSHGTPFLPGSRITGGGDQGATAGSDLVIVTAGAKQRDGETRIDLAARNVAILDGLLPGLVERSPDAVFVLVTNPCDVLTVRAARVSGLPAGRVLSSGTVLDSSRLRRAIADRARVPAQNVHALIVGEHGDTGFPLWSQARIGGIPLVEWTDEDGRVVFDRETRDRIAADVVEAAYRVIRGKGATNHAIGVASARIAEAVLGDERAILPVSSVLDGVDGVPGPDRVALSLPSMLGRSGVERVLDIPMTPEERGLLARSARAIEDAVASAG